MNSNINMTGSVSVGSQIFDNIFSLPGALGVTNTLPYYPKYESPMGVFYISAKPVIIGTVQSTLQQDGNYLVDQRYTIEESSFQLIFNPAVTNAATISNIKKEVVMMDLTTPSSSSILRIGATTEQVADKLIYTGAGTTGIESQGPRPRLIVANLAVRISFDVIPNNGSPKCTIVKTFLATQG
jgi:hypothetical protein